MRYLFIAIACASTLLGQGTPDASLKRLLQGNERYTSDKLLHPRRDSMRREATESKQEPFATVLACSDSRVSPEIVFDQGVGDIFVVRVAGNVLGDVELDSIDYASLFLHSPLILVLGHENCGAVTAVLHGKTDGIEAVANLIEPALTDINNEEGNLLENAIKDNVRHVVQELKEKPTLKPLIEEGKVKVAGGYYQLVSGKVEILN